MARIAISYRRDDSGVITGRIFDRLVARYGRETIFRDIDDIPFGIDFRTHISQVLGITDVVIAVIGPHWAGPTASQSRLSNETDPVRLELEEALRKGLAVIPVLVLGAIMPTVTELPESLRDFAYRNAIHLDAGQDFDVHMGRLIRAVDGLLGISVQERTQPGYRSSTEYTSPRARSRYHLAALFSLTILFGFALNAWFFGLPQKILPPVEPTRLTIPPVSSAASPPSPPAAETAPAGAFLAPSSVQPESEAETILWNIASSSRQRKDFEQYLNVYPNGKFADEARRRIANAADIPAPRYVDTTTGESCSDESGNIITKSRDSLCRGPDGALYRGQNWR